MRLAILGSLLLLLSVTVSEAQVEAPKEALVAQVRISIDKAVKYLRQKQRENGSWDEGLPAAAYPGGWSALALLALLNAGLPPEDPTVAKGLAHLRDLEPDTTYVRALQTIVLAEAGRVQDLEVISRNVKWLIEARVFKDGQFQGWSYHKPGRQNPDGSNIQYALLGLWAGKQSGAEISKEIWESIRDFYVREQEADGGWSYMKRGDFGPVGPNLTMTVAGVCGLLIAGMELNAGRETIQPNGVALRCGEYDESTPLARGLRWIGRPGGFHVALPQKIFYNLYGIERLGRLSGLRFLGNHDWYREGCNWLVKNQNADGSWHAIGQFDNWPVVSTSFGLLFLSKGRTPVLISKLVHGDWPRKDADTDWNNDRNDLRNLTDFVGKELFKKLPLAWQNFDIMRGLAGATDDPINRITSELLPSPIVYFNGHQSPRLRFTANELAVLRKYIENGGFILAEACCNSPEFDQGFKALVTQLFPGDKLTDLTADHPVWKSFFLITPGDPYRLMGIQQGCKTVLIYSPQDLSCQWEGNHFKEGRGERAFKLGANIIAYATGMEPPRPRLTEVRVARREDASRIKRGFLKVAQIEHTGDWQPAPRAMANLMDYLRQNAGVDVSLEPQKMKVHLKKIVDFKFLYMHGRGKFEFGKEELENLRFNLENGGLLFADACCGKEAFDLSFRALVRDLFPKEKLEPIPPDDLLFSQELNGELLGENTIRARIDKGGAMRNMVPWLEGIKTNGRWAVIYSKYDIGCALERHQAPDCLGYHPDSAFKLAAAAVLYTLRP